MSNQILYVEDDIESANILTLYLQKAGLTVHHYDNVVDASRALTNLTFELALFDVMLPGGDGRTLLKHAVEKGIPSIMLTAVVDEEARILGFELGADDYVCKPYSPREVVSRVSALLRRSERNHQKTQIVSEGLIIDLTAKQVTLDAQWVPLTAAEFTLLETLASSPSQVFSREQLLDKINKDNTPVNDRIVDTHLANLRKKLRENKHTPRFIVTRYKLGYQFIGAIS
ncbi:response regulator transcription factor [Aestuariibacter sp. AA17]|uniref:Response regulator transcription factor n=1 Tax=Fluctibacter corallii TaxID=2984329 RepID=A0ABT3A3B8_9ALTE|nr:response regulator transcription factor [Aestuariibacter sp. AA17]MCV2883167.1 response regulator transcription factor [Aestuariibacter sp. AA17]